MICLVSERLLQSRFEKAMDHFSSDSIFQEVSKGDCKRNYMHFGHSQTPAKHFGAILAMLFSERPFQSVEAT
jgi:hypothetical protein